MSPDRQEKVLDELREREKRTNRRVLGEATKPKQRFDAESEYQVRSLLTIDSRALPAVLLTADGGGQKMMAKADYTADYQNIPGKKVGEGSSQPAEDR